LRNFGRHWDSLFGVEGLDSGVAGTSKKPAGVCAGGLRLKSAVGSGF
jgi:hypothetical protein